MTVEALGLGPEPRQSQDRGRRSGPDSPPGPPDAARWRTGREDEMYERAAGAARQAGLESAEEEQARADQEDRDRDREYRLRRVPHPAEQRSNVVQSFSSKRSVMCSGHNFSRVFNPAPSPLWTLRLAERQYGWCTERSRDSSVGCAVAAAVGRGYCWRHTAGERGSRAGQGKIEMEDTGYRCR